MSSNSAIRTAVRQALCVGALTTAAGYAPLASAQGSDDVTLEEITVTATKREQGIYDVPLAMTAFDGANIERQGVADLVDGKRALPPRHGFDLGARARQIRNDLLALQVADEAAMLAIQLDDRAVFLDRWRKLVLHTLDDPAVADHPSRRVFRELVETTWTGQASVESASFRLTRAFRMETFELVYGRFLAPLTEADERFSIYRFGQWEDSLWRMVTQQPEDLLGPDHPTWKHVLLAAVDSTMEYFESEIGPDPELWTWGHRNTVRIGHPISMAVPQLSGWLDMPPRQLPGDSNMPRVQSSRFGASERFAVSPGREEEGYFHMPGGQSGHPMSPHYRAGHEAWAEGKPTPFLPGKTETTLTLVPAGG